METAIFPVFDRADFEPDELEAFLDMDLDAFYEELEALVTDLVSRPTVRVSKGYLGGSKWVKNYKANVVAHWRNHNDDLILYTSTGHELNFTDMMARMRDFQAELKEEK